MNLVAFSIDSIFILKNCACVRDCVRVYVFESVCTHARSCISCECARAFVRACVCCVCACTCMCGWVCTRVCACARAR